MFVATAWTDFVCFRTGTLNIIGDIACWGKYLDLVCLASSEGLLMTRNLAEFRAVTKFINCRIYRILTKLNIALGGPRWRSC